LVVVIVSATCGGIAFACAGQPVWLYFWSILYSWQTAMLESVQVLHFTDCLIFLLIMLNFLRLLLDIC